MYDIFYRRGRVTCVQCTWLQRKFCKILHEHEFIISVYYNRKSSVTRSMLHQLLQTKTYLIVNIDFSESLVSAWGVTVVISLKSLDQRALENLPVLMIYTLIARYSSLKQTNVETHLDKGNTKVTTTFEVILFALNKTTLPHLYIIFKRQ